MAIFIDSQIEERLERLQEKALRETYRDKSSMYNELLLRAKLPTLLNRGLHDIAILTNEVKNSSCPRFVVDLFSSNRSGNSLGNADDFAIPRHY